MNLLTFLKVLGVSSLDICGNSFKAQNYIKNTF